MNSIQFIALSFIDNPNDKTCERLYNRLFPGLRKFISSKLTNDNIYNKHDVINDIISATFYNVLNKIHQYNYEYNFSTWVYAIAQNETYAFLESIKHNVKHGMNDIYKLDDFLTLNKRIDIDEFDMKYDIIEFQENEDGINDLINKTKDCIQELQPIYKDIIEDREINSMKYVDIQKKYKIPINTVKSRIKLGKNILRDKMKKRYRKLYDNLDF